MSKKTSTAKIKKLVDAIICGMQDKKANDIVLIDLKNVKEAVCEFMIICHGDSNTQVDAIAGSISKQTKILVNEKPTHVEGVSNAEWILLDYFNVIAHVFYKETREFYNLEGLWEDASGKKIVSEHLEV